MPITGQQIRSLPPIDPDRFRAQGYTIVRQLFSNSEVEQMRAAAKAVVAKLEGTGPMGGERGPEGVIHGAPGDLLSRPSLRHVLLDPRVLAVAERLLGSQPLYFGDSSFRTGKSGARAWHRDNVDRGRARGGPDWHDPYPLLRCGIYLQDQARHSGGLMLRPGSNRPGRLRPSLPRLVDAHAGDLVAWDLRTVHSGEAVRMRGLPNLALHPRLQTALPERMRVPDGSERIAFFMTFALPGPHLDRYLRYLKSRDYMLHTWSESSFGPEVWEEAKKAGLEVLAPVPVFGSAREDRVAADSGS